MSMITLTRTGVSENVALVTLNRPNTLNALCRELMQELSETLLKVESDSTYNVIVLTGSEKAFAAGADIKEMAKLEFTDVFQKNDFFANWDTLSRISKPVVAAVNGFALGGGTELALMCDIVYAGENSIFGQPEVTIGTIPGLGGTQRWPRFTNKSVAMEICLTGDRLTAQDAKEVGLVSKVFPTQQVVREAVIIADRIAKNSPLIVKTVKTAVNSAYETSLSQGLQLEKHLFQSTFATHDRREGMTAFAEKRAAKWEEN